jgi:hypothetical protein
MEEQGSEITQDKGGFLAALETPLSYIIPIINAAVGFFLGWHITEQTIHLEMEGREVHIFASFVRYSLSASFAILFGFFGAVAVEHLKLLRRVKRDRREFLNLLDRRLENRLGRMIEHSAFFTENGRLENIVQLLKNTPGKKKWIVAKFISRQLSDTFLADFRMEIDGHSYSAFAESLYQECEESIFLTSPFTPEEWFRQLVSDDKIRRIEQGTRNALGEHDIPAHVEALFASPAPVKRRLVILPADKWSEVIDSTKANFMKEFLKINKGVDTRFINQADLQDKLGFDYSGEFDYAIFDRKLLLKWERPINGRDKKPLCLYTEVPEAYRRLLELFDYDRHGMFFKTGAAILNDIRARQTRV